MTHPAQFSQAIIEQLAVHIQLLGIERVFDPFAGPGERLGNLCADMHVEFAGCDIEDWPGRWYGVEVADATLLDPETFRGKWVITSPTYANGINDHFKPKDDSKRYTYRIALGQPLHENNSGRYSIRGGEKAWRKYWKINSAAVQRWSEAEGAIVNVKDFIAASELIELGHMWTGLLTTAGFTVVDRIKVVTPGMRNGANADLRADGEWLIVATR